MPTVFIANPTDMKIPAADNDYSVFVYGQLHIYYPCHGIHTGLSTRTFLMHPHLHFCQSWFGFKKLGEPLIDRPSICRLAINTPHYLQFTKEEMPIDYINFPSREFVPTGRCTFIKSLIRYHCLDKVSKDYYVFNNPTDPQASTVGTP